MKKRTRIEIVTLGLILSLFALNVVQAILWNAREDRILLVQIDEASGARLIVEEDEALIMSQQKALIRRLVSQMYNYSSDTYERSISKAGDLMSQDAWNRAMPEFISIKDKVAEVKIEQQSAINKISRIDDSKYRLELELTVQDKLVSRKATVQLDVELQRRKRDEINQFGWEVASYEESIIAAAR